MPDDIVAILTEQLRAVTAERDELRLALRFFACEFDPLPDEVGGRRDTFGPVARQKKLRSL